MTTYTLRVFGEGRRGMVYERRDINAAQLGGLIAHTIEDYSSFLVIDSEDRIVMRYKRKGML
jgi:hypothetical protein